MLNVVIFASDAKGLSSLNSIIKDLSKQGHRLFAMVTQSTTLQYPQNKNEFQILCNVPRSNSLYSNSLGEWLPFTPDFLIVNRERWNPEEHIIREFKKKFNCKVALVEPNACLLNNAESRLETYSKNRFKDLVDVYFVGSEHSKQQQINAGLEANMAVVGNPKYDLNLEVPEDQKQQLKEFYNIDETQRNVLFFSLVNQHRTNINQTFKFITEKYPNDRYFYKPYPGEPFDSKFVSDYKPEFMIQGCTPILQENHIWTMFELCDTHVGVMSSIIHATLLKGKKYVDLSLALEIDKKYLDFSGVFSEGGPGLENNKAMWMRSFGFTNEKQLRDLLPDSYKEAIEKSNQRVWDNLQNPEVLLTLFDDWNDGKASKRIINYLENAI